jgi:hypothetical protein
MKTARRSQIRFAVCIRNKGYEASLELGKLYPVIPDKDAAEHGYLRIVDESGEDCGYAADRFFAIAVPKPLQKVLLRRRRDNRSPSRALQRSAARVARPGR